MNVEILHHGRVIRGDLTLPRIQRMNMRMPRIPAVLLVHGKAADRTYRWFPALHRRLTRAGFAVLSIDLSGHGQSDGRFEDLTYTRVVHDVIAAARFLAKQPNVNPRSLGAVGHSLGGAAVVIAAAQQRLFRGMVLVASVGDLRWRIRHTYSAHERRMWQRTNRYEWFDVRLQKTLWLKFTYWKDASRYDTLALARSIHQPSLVIAAGRDNSIMPRETQRLFRALNEPKRLVMVPGARHSFRQAFAQRKLLGTMVPWLKRFVAQTESRSVVAVLSHANRYLVMERSPQVWYYQGKWGIIGGHLPDHADPHKHIYHEILEETGIPRSKLKLVKAARFVRLEHPEIGKTWISKPFLFESSTAEVKLDWEHTAYQWVKLEKFPFKQSYPGIAKQFKALGLL